MNKQEETDNLTNIVLQVTSDQKPKTVEQLVELVIQRNVKDEETLEERVTHMRQKEEILKVIMKLQEQGKLHLTPASPDTPTISAYLKTSATLWFWAVIALTIATLVAVFTIPEMSFPFVYVRYTLGAIFILWLPGYAFVKALFPQKLLNKSNSEELDAIERVALSIGMSLAIVPLIGLLLNYTPWGISLTPIILSLVAVTVILAVAAIVREHRFKTRDT